MRSPSILVSRFVGLVASAWLASAVSVIQNRSLPKATGAASAYATTECHQSDHNENDSVLSMLAPHGLCEKVERTARRGFRDRHETPFSRKRLSNRRFCSSANLPLRAGCTRAKGSRQVGISDLTARREFGLFIAQAEPSSFRTKGSTVWVIWKQAQGKSSVLKSSVDCCDREQASVAGRDLTA